jgi:ubiquitin C-terminal hydrolase
MLAHILQAARQDAENSEDWNCPACDDLTQAKKDTKISYAEEKEMIKSDLAIYMGSGRTALNQP